MSAEAAYDDFSVFFYNDVQYSLSVRNLRALMSAPYVESGSVRDLGYFPMDGILSLTFRHLSFDPGNYVVRFCIDSTNLVPELYENNNCITSLIQN